MKGQWVSSTRVHETELGILKMPITGLSTFQQSRWGWGCVHKGAQDFRVIFSGGET